MECRPYGHPEPPIVPAGGPESAGQGPPEGDHYAQSNAVPAMTRAQRMPEPGAQENAPRAPTFAQLIGAAPLGGAQPEAGGEQQAYPYPQPLQEEPAYTPPSPYAGGVYGMPPTPMYEAPGGFPMPEAEMVPAGPYVAAEPMPAYWAGFGYAPSQKMEAPADVARPAYDRDEGQPAYAPNMSQPGYASDVMPPDYIYSTHPQGCAQSMPGFAPDVQGYIPDMPGYSPDPQGYTPDMQGYATDPQGCAYDAQGYTSSPQGYAYDTPGYSPDPQGYVQSPQGYAPDPQGYAPDPQGYAPDPQGYATDPQPYAPDARSYPTSNMPAPMRQPSFGNPPFRASQFSASPPPFGEPSMPDEPYGPAPMMVGEAQPPNGAAHAAYNPNFVPMEPFGPAFQEGNPDFWPPQGYWQQPEWQGSDWSQEGVQPRWLQAQDAQPAGRKPRALRQRRASNALGMPQTRPPNALTLLLQRAFATPKIAANTLMNIAYYALVLLILGSAIRFALDDDPKKMLLGLRPYTVLTNSMRSSGPESFSAGDIIVVHKIDPAQVKVGDIITYQPGSDKSVYLTHRVIKKLDSYKDVEGDWFVTKGDANNTEDLPVRGSTIVGKKLFVIPRLGHVMRYIYSNIALVSLMLAAALGMFIVLRIYFSNAKKSA